MTQETQKIWSLYRITNLLNNKVYIGQTIAPRQRWYDHKQAAKNSPTQAIHHAIIKHGVENFEFEIIASCKSQDDANDLETELIKQYESHVSVGKGYNVTLGGMNAPKTDEWKKIISQKAQERAPITSEQMAAIAANRPEDYYEHLKGNQHALGVKHTDEWKEMMSNREHSEEEDKRRSESLKKAYAEGRRVSATKGKPSWNKGVPMTNEQKEKLRQSLIGRVPHNKKNWLPEEIEKIKSDTRTLKEIAEDYGVHLSTISRLKKL